MNYKALRRLVNFFAFIFFLGNLLLLILIITSGFSEKYPINRFFWLQADTMGIPGAPDTSRWTFWGLCSYLGGHDIDCGEHVYGAYPISPVDNFHTDVNVPSKFITDRETFFYLSRFSFAFFWIALGVIGISLVIFILSWCFKEVIGVTFPLMLVGMLFNLVATILQTAVNALAKDAFHDAHRSANIGAAMMGMAWGSAVLSIIEFLVITFSLTKRERNPTYYPNTENSGFFHKRRDSIGDLPEPMMSSDGVSKPGPDNASTTQPPSDTEAPVGAPVVAPVVGPEATAGKGINFFRIRRNEDSSIPDEVSV